MAHMDTGGSQPGTGGRGAAGAAGGASGSGGHGGGSGGSADVRDASFTDAAVADAGVQALSWPNQDSQANSDAWLAEHNTEITELHPRVLVLNFANRIAPDKMQTLADEHIAVWKKAYRLSRRGRDAVRLTCQIAKIVDLRDGSNAVNSNKLPISGNAVDYGALNSAQFAALIGIEDPDSPGTPLTLCQLFEKV